MDEKEEAQEIQIQAEKEAAEKAAQANKAAVPGVPDGPVAKERVQTKPTEKVRSPLEEARALDKSIKESNEQMKQLLEKHEKVLADARVEGHGFAGQGAQVAETDDDKWAREAKERYKGMGLDPTPDDSPTTYS